MKKYISLVVFAVSFSFSSVSNAALIINFVENGSNIEASYSGSIDLDATQGIRGQSLAYNGLIAGFGAVAFGSGNTEFYGIDIATWTPFGTGTNFFNWSASSGNTLALFSDPVLGLEEGYVSGSVLSGQATLLNESFASIGAEIGSFVSTISNGNFTDTVTVNIGQGPVVQPVSSPSVIALFLGVLAFLGMRKLKK